MKLLFERQNLASQPNVVRVYLLEDGSVEEVYHTGFRYPLSGADINRLLELAVIWVSEGSNAPLGREYHY